MDDALFRTIDDPRLEMTNFKHIIKAKDKSKYKDSIFLLRGITQYKYAEHIRNMGCIYFYVDTGYFGNFNVYYKSQDIGKKRFHRVVLNAMQTTNFGRDGRQRLDDVLQYIEDISTLKKNDFIFPWNHKYKNILLCPSTKKSAVYLNIDNEQWIKETTEELRKYSDREILVRIKPKSRNYRTYQDTFQHYLDDNKIGCVVVTNSIAATDAVMHGIPAITLYENAASFVSRSKLSQINNLIYPNRDKWLGNLALDMCSAEEITNGYFVNMMFERAEEYYKG